MHFALGQTLDRCSEKGRHINDNLNWCEITFLKICLLLIAPDAHALSTEYLIQEVVLEEKYEVIIYLCIIKYRFVQRYQRGHSVQGNNRECLW